MNKLQVARRIAGLTTMEMAQKLGISQTYYISLETGFAKPKKPEIYKKIANLVGLKPEELFEEVTLQTIKG